MSDKNIYRRLADVVGDMGHIEKNGHNSSQNYDYVQASDVLAAVRPLFLKHGLVVVPDVGTLHSIDPSPKGTQLITTVGITFTVVNVDTPEERFTFNSIGSGADSNDKGVFKAITGGIKYGLMELLMLSTGDDPERDTGTVETGGDGFISPNQLAPLKAAYERADPDEDKFFAFVSGIAGGEVTSLDTIPKRVYQKVLKQLNKAAKAKTP